jgi:hypothetical protein
MNDGDLVTRNLMCKSKPAFENKQLFAAPSTHHRESVQHMMPGTAVLTLTHMERAMSCAGREWRGKMPQ